MKAFLPLIAFVACASPAWAGQCGMMSARVFPWKLGAIPTNARIHLQTYHWTPGTQTQPNDSFSLVSAHGEHVALAQARDVVPIVRLGPTEGVNRAWHTLAAEHLLVAHEGYRLLQGAEPVWPNEAHPVIAAITTTPTFSVRRARYIARKAKSDKGSLYGNYVSVELAATSGDASQIFFEIHALDLEGQPPVWRDLDEGRVDFGAVGNCGYVDFDLPKHGRQRFELRAIDLAGNISAPTVITVDADHPSALTR